MRQIGQQGHVGQIGFGSPLVEIVATWIGQRAEADVRRRQPVAGAAPSVEPEEIAAPAFLGSDRVDEEDDKRLYGGERRLLPWIFGIGLVAAAVAAGAFFLVNRDTDEPAEQIATSDPAPTAIPAQDPLDEPETPTAPTATAEPAPTVEPTRSVYWADTTTVLNSGTGEISASTYSVSASNRAVLTGHTAAITGVVVSDEGRVLTSGADNRLVDWGADVSLASPDVLNVAAPLTMLIRTVDQRLVAGDAQGNITVIDLVTEGAEPIVIAVHGSAISAADELEDGRLAVASVDGAISVFAIDAPTEIVSLPHDVEVTAVVGLTDGRVATAAVDGGVRLWPVGVAGEPELIESHQAPVTALTALSDGRIASGDVNGALHILPATTGATPDVIVDAHRGPIRALLEITLPSGERALASGGDDSTIRLSDPASGSLLRVLEGHGDLVSALNVLPDGRLVSTSGDGTGRVWDLTLPAGAPTQAPHEWNISDLAPWSNDQFVSGGADGLVMLDSTSETTGPTQITRHGGPVVGVAVMPNGDVVSLDALSTLHVSDAAGGAAPIEIQVAPGATTLDARQSLGVVTGHADGSVKFHDLTQEVASVDAHGSGVNDVAALSNGLVVSAGQDQTVRVIDFDEPERVLVFDLHTAPVNVVAELPDGRVASAGTDGIYVWSVDDIGGDSIRLNGHRTTTLSLVGLPNNRLLSTAVDGRVRLWDLATPESEPATLIDIPGIVNPHLIQADNGQFVAGAGRGYVVFTFQ